MGGIDKVAVIGSHAGSNLEPLYMLMSVYEISNIRVYGTVYPFPELLCQDFGYCESNELILGVVRELVS